MKSADMRITQALALKESTPGGQSLPKSSITMLLPEKSALPSLKANVKLKNLLFYLSNLNVESIQIHTILNLSTTGQVFISKCLPVCTVVESISAS